MTRQRVISVTGLGYVGLPVAVAFGRKGPVIGFDIDAGRISELRQGVDRTNEVSSDGLKAAEIRFTEKVALLADANFHIVTVPTPIDEQRRPALDALTGATGMLGAILKPGDIIVYESTVYPGATEELCVPILEDKSGLRYGVDFSVGYSPERINPGDGEHRFESIRKVIAANDENTLEIMQTVYGSVVTAGVYRAASIKVAETAKVLENTQRDLNIALANELAMICHRLEVDTRDVIATAATKWNFSPFWPGLVGGHCIGVDPYYLTHKAIAVGHTPKVILAGRDINSEIPGFVADTVRRWLQQNAPAVDNHRVTLLGLTFKENVPDIRNSAAIDIVNRLQIHGIDVQVHDPLAHADELRRQYGIELMGKSAMKPAQAAILAVAHDEYVTDGWANVRDLLQEQRGLVFDIKGILARPAPPGMHLIRL